jgi:hypothetical protein
MADPRDTADDEEKGAYDERLKNALQNLRSSRKPYACIVNLAKPVDLFWLSRGQVNAKQKEMLTSLSGTKNFSKAGTVTRIDNTLVIDIQGAGKGMAGRIQTAIQKAVGMRLKVMVGGEVAEESEEVSAADAKAAAPAKAAPSLAKAPQVWRGTHDMLAKRIGMLKDSVRKHYGPQGKELLAQIDRQLAQLDAVTDKLDRSLSDALAEVARAPADQRRDATARAARQAADYIAWVKKDPLVRHIDGNPFGVPTQIEALVSKSLGEIAKSLATA